MPDYALMNQFLYEGNGPKVAEMTQAALDEGKTPQEVLSEGLIAGMSVVGEDFKHNVLYVPEVLIAARAMKAGMAVLKPLLAGDEEGGNSSKVGTLMMGTVRGDLHDIGKNLVCMMAEGAGFEVVDIGVDQSVEKFMAAADNCKPDIIGMSALLTTTMTYMKTVIDGFEADGRDVKFAIGGAPISQMFADEIGADGYGADASSAVDLFLSFMGKGDAPTNKPTAAPAAAPAADQPKGTQTTYQILYWQDLPAQIKASDEYTEVKLELPTPFMERIDAAAQRLGLTAEVDYTAQFKWGDEQDRAGDAATVAAAVQAELEASAS
ncbi:virulence factor [Actomonas aquatica]|uniref:Virulence factor n=1 Tax=Actomonas aquatica TaxID=2866162 RepID=A0ABZ1C2U4_9BACT|nr:virulence factor [Opitutus sp. WL0086]WRQ85864.1 virulence factor [Opitutus sp. WL0086]